MNTTATAESEVVSGQDLLEASPKTLKEWKELLAAYPQNSLKVMQKLDGGAGTNWTPNHTLIQVYGDWAIILPPGHKKTEKVPLRSIKLWKKGMANLLDRMGVKVGTGTGIRTPPGAGKEAFSDPTRIVVYCGKTGGFLGTVVTGKNCTNVFTRPLAEATPFKTRDTASVAVCNYFKKNGSSAATMRPTIEYLTKAKALARFRDPGEPEEPSPDEAVAPGKAETQAIEPPADQAQAQLPAAPEPPPAPPTAPEGRQVAIPEVAAVVTPIACQECFQAYARTLTEEAEAEALLLEARGARIKAETRYKLDQERRRLGIA